MKSPIWSLLVVLALMFAYSVFFSAYSIQRHKTFRTHASDMGQMDQALWNTLNGNLLEDTRPNGTQLPRLTDHVEPIFLVIPFAFLIYDGIETLFVLQSVAIALGALPVFWIARRRFYDDVRATGGGKPRPYVEIVAIMFAALYLLFPALEAANLAEFHAVTFAPAPLLLAYHYAQARAWKRYACFALVALAVKEEIALLVFAMAVWAAVIKSQVPSPKSQVVQVLKPETWNLRHVNTVPIFIAIFSIAWFLIAVFVIVPRFAPGGRSVYIGRYTCASAALRDPITAIPDLVGCVVTPEKITYVLQLLASVGFLALFDPLPLLVGAPALVLNLLSSYAAQYSGTYHYSAPVAPYFVLAAIGGAARILNSKFVIRNSVVLAAALVVALGYHLSAGYTPLGGEYFFPQLTPHHQLLARFTAQIPRAAPATTSATLFPHLSHRRVLYRYPLVKDAQSVLLDVSQANVTNPIDYVVNYRELLKQGFGIRDAADGYILLERGAARQELPDEFYSFVRAPTAAPQYRAPIDFEGRLRFLGLDVRQDDWERVYLRTYWERLPGMNLNYALFPFFPDESSAPRDDLQLPPLMIHFWYPTSAWRADEVIIADTLPVPIGTRAQIGVGVFFGADWNSAEHFLKPRADARVAADGKWVKLGELVREGKRYTLR